MIIGPHNDHWGRYISVGYLLPDFLTSFSRFTDLNKCKVFVIRSISLLTYNLGLPYLVHTFDHGGYMSTRCLSSDSDLIYTVYWFFCKNLNHFFMIRSVSLIPCILGNTIFAWSTTWSWRVHVHVAWPCLLFHGLLALLNLLHFFVIRSVFLMPFNIGLSNLVHTLMMEGKKGRIYSVYR